MLDIVERPSLTAQIGGLGFGAGALGNLYREITDAEAMTALRAALDHGVTYFDTAPHYGFGLSEERLGHLIGETGGVSEIVVSTKVGRVLVPTTASDLRTARQGFISPEPYDSVFDYGYDGIMRSFEESRRRLGRDIDILYVHDLGLRTHGDRHSDQMRLFMNEGIRAMRGLREQGAVRAIGLGVNEWQVCEEVLAIADLDIVLLAGAVCVRHRVPLAAAALQFSLAHPAVVSVIPGMSSAAEVAAAVRWMSIPIPAACWQELRQQGLLRADAPIPVTS